MNFGFTVQVFPAEITVSHSVKTRSSREAPDRNMCVHSAGHPIGSGGVTLLWQNLEYVPPVKMVRWC